MADREDQDPAARSKRIAESARQEKAAIRDLDRAAARLAVAEARRRDVVAKAEVTVQQAERAHREALAAYARCAGPERAAFHLDLDARQLRRLVRQVPG